MEQYFSVGTIVNTQGLKGEVRVISVTDFAKERYKKGSVLTLFQDGKAPIELTVKSHRKHKNFDLLTFEGKDRIEDVEIYKGGTLKITSEAMHDLGEEEFYFHEIIGLEMKLESGESLGKVKEILPLGSNDVWVVKREGKKDLLLPYIKDVIKEVNVAEGYAVATPLEGMLEE